MGDKVKHFGPAFQVVVDEILSLLDHPERADEIARVVANFRSREFGEWHAARLREYGYEERFNDSDGGSSYLVAIKPDQSPEDRRFYDLICSRCKERRGDHIMGRCPEWEFAYSSE